MTLLRYAQHFSPFPYLKKEEGFLLRWKAVVLSTCCRRAVKTRSAGGGTAQAFPLWGQGASKEQPWTWHSGLLAGVHLLVHLITVAYLLGSSLPGTQASQAGLQAHATPSAKKSPTLSNSTPRASAFSFMKSSWTPKLCWESLSELSPCQEGGSS